MNEFFARDAAQTEETDWIAAAVGARAIRRGQRLQSLWSDYGEIYRVHFEGAAFESAVVKRVKPPERGRSDRSHARKCRSYDVEMEWYRRWSARCNEACRVPALYASRATKNAWLFVLEDLDATGFSGRRSRSRTSEIEPCLAWLAALHAEFLGVAPKGLWREGSYWHLGTRPDELVATRDIAIRAAAPALDAALAKAAYRTIVHGDAKLDNFCFSQDGRAVAAVDFQYVGGGCGMRDVAYLLHGIDRAAEARLLGTYFRSLEHALAPRAIDSVAVEREWRRLYPTAVADFERFLAGWGA